ncbi:MAG TPA: hypothetical protein VMX14_09405 [Anaerolineae bacterium]|nr:hypothetical protein [Anaerolineae bacterium]
MDVSDPVDPAEISPRAISQVPWCLGQDGVAFSQRDLSHLSSGISSWMARLSGSSDRDEVKMALVSWALCADGRNVLLHVALRSEESWA